MKKFALLFSMLVGISFGMSDKPDTKTLTDTAAVISSSGELAESDTSTQNQVSATQTGMAADYQTSAIAPHSILMGYLIEGYTPSDAQFKKMTHVAFSFLRASDEAGNITMTEGWENLDQVVAAAHKNGVKAIISFGGGEFKVTKKLMGNEANRKNLIKNIVLFMKEHHFDGFDSDWEPSWIDDKTEMEAVNNAITHHFLDFMRDMRAALDSEFGKGAKSFSAAVLNQNNIYYSEEKQIAHFPQNGWWQYLDWVALMNYDNDLGAKHATLESVFGPEGSVAYWSGFGVPKGKLVVGVPFYARAGWGDEWLFYKDIVEMNASLSDSIDFIHYDKGTGAKDYGYNGVMTVKAKVKAMKEHNLPGIMFWQLAGDVDVNSEKSLLKALSE